MTEFVSSRNRTAHRSAWWQALGEIGSVRAAAVLIATLIAVVMAAGWYERAYGAEAVQVMVYQAWWFDALFALFALCVAAAAIVRFPWKRHQYGFVVVHIGLLLIIAGFWRAGHDRLDGLLEAVPGQEASRIDLPVDQLVVIDQAATPPAAGDAVQKPAWANFRFLALCGLPSLPRFVLSPLWPLPGPGIHTLPTPAEAVRVNDQVRLRITRVVETGAPELGWIADPAGQAAAVRLRLNARTPAGPAELGNRWLTTDPRGDSVFTQGPLSATLARTRQPALVEDFLSEAPEAAGNGRLFVYHQGRREVVALDRLPATVELAPDLAVTAVRVITNPKHTDDGLSQEDGEPANPVVELAIRQGAGATATTRTAFASAYHLLPPLGGGKDLPEFLFRHPQLDHPAAGGTGAFLQLLAGPDGRLHIRSWSRSGGALARTTISGGTWNGIIAGGATQVMQLNAEVTWLPTAEQAPTVLDMRPDHKDRAVRWIEVEAVGRTGSIRAWLPRGGRQALAVPGYGDLFVSFQRAQFDLRSERGFAIRLERFTEGKDPGGMMSASYASEVTVLRGSGDSAADATATATVSMNEPLEVAGVTLYQTQFFPEIDAKGQPTGRQVSVFTAAEDPGRLLKYLGSVTLVLGILLLWWLRPRAK